MNLIEYVEVLDAKKRLLAKIIGNTESQVRFIRQQKMVGLRRLLRTRSQLLDSLASLNQQEATGGCWADQPEVQDLRGKIRQAEQQLLAVSSLAVQLALKEQNRIADQMRGNSQAREIHHTYVGRWYQGISRGFSRKA
jgi:hypothetical protein